MPKYFPNPFAVNGDKTAVPDDTDPNGYVSYDTGYTFDYERDPDPVVDPLTKDIERDKMNQLFFDITDNIKHLQDTGGVPEWSSVRAANGGYPRDAKVILGGTIYTSTVNGNASTPGASPTWILGGQTDPTIQAIAGTTPGANTFIWFSATDVAQVAAITSFGRSLVGAVSATQARTLLGVGASNEAVAGLTAAATQAEVNGSGAPGFKYVRPQTLRAGVQTDIDNPAIGNVTFPQWFSTGQIPQFRYLQMSLSAGQSVPTGDQFPNACVMAVACLRSGAEGNAGTFSPMATVSGRGATIRNLDNSDNVNVTVFMIGY